MIRKRSNVAATSPLHIPQHMQHQFPIYPRDMLFESIRLRRLEYPIELIVMSADVTRHKKGKQVRNPCHVLREAGY